MTKPPVSLPDRPYEQTSMVFRREESGSHVVRFVMACIMCGEMIQAEFMADWLLLREKPSRVSTTLMDMQLDRAAEMRALFINHYVNVHRALFP